MRVVITGGCGFLGSSVAAQLLRRDDIDELVLFDNSSAAVRLPEDRRLRRTTGDIADRKTLRAVITAGTGSVFHLAAVVSGQAEADTDLGYRVNLDGTRAVLDACRALGNCPRVVFASSLAVYGGALLPAGVRRHHASDAADLLRHAKGDRRIAGQRLQPQGICRRPRGPLADRRRA